jgi:hypothetical protein
VHDRPELGCPECGSVIAREAGEAVFVSALLSDEVVERIEQVLLGFVETPNDAAKAAHLSLQAVIEQVGGGRGEG